MYGMSDLWKRFIVSLIDVSVMSRHTLSAWNLILHYIAYLFCLVFIYFISDIFSNLITISEVYSKQAIIWETNTKLMVSMATQNIV